MWPQRFEGLPRAVVLGHELPIANTRLSRLLGLALLDRLEAGAGMLIPRCRAVHTLGMRFALDLVFLNRTGRVVAQRRGVPPWRFASCPGAEAVVELPTR